MDFSDKVVLVTGGSSGIGAVTAIYFGQMKASVAIVGRNQTNLNIVASQIENKSKKPLIIKADVSKEDELRTIVKKCIDKFGKLDILVNNAGLLRFASLLDDNLSDVFDEVMTTNLRSTVILTSLAAPYLIKTKGNVINISSVLGTSTKAVSNNLSYNVSKAAMDHFTRCAALELAPLGVRVNCVKPGPVKTPIMSSAGISDAEDFWEGFKVHTALNKIGEPEEIAELVAFLASDKAKSITGSIFVSDNGFLIK